MTKLAETFLKELPADCINYIIQNPDYVLPFLEVPGPFKPTNDSVQKMLRKAEVAAVEATNRAYMKMLREKLILNQQQPNNG